MKEAQIKKAVREGYAKIAKQRSCGCCGGGDSAEHVSQQIGYSEEELEIVPQGEHIIIGDMPIQILPNISPLHNTAVEEADKVEVGGVITKVIGREYLIALSLVAFRPTDKWRVVQLLKRSDTELLDRILSGFDNEDNQLCRKYEEILGIS